MDETILVKVKFLEDVQNDLLALICSQQLTPQVRDKIRDIEGRIDEILLSIPKEVEFNI